MIVPKKAIWAIPLALLICTTANAIGVPVPKPNATETVAAAEMSRTIYANYLQELDNKGMKLEQYDDATREVALPWTFYPMFSDSKNCAWTVKPPADKPGVLALFKITRNGAQVCENRDPTVTRTNAHLNAITPTRVIVGPRSCLWLLEPGDDGMPHLAKLTSYNDSSLCTRRPNQDPR
jgi:hypothetical protein